MTAKTNETVCLLPFPALEDGNLSFEKASYKGRVEPSKEGDSLTIKHQLEGAPFLQNLLNDKRAKFGCLVSIPKTGYRQLNLSDAGEVEQTFSIDKAYWGELPMVRPVLVANEEIAHTFTDKDGVTDLWQGGTAVIPKGGWLARGRYLKPRLGIIDLLKPVKDKSFPPTAIEVKESTEEGFRFIVNLGAKLYDFVVRPGAGNEHSYHNIHVFMVSRCLEILQKKYTKRSDESDDDGLCWDNYPNLKMLAADLEEKGHNHWDHEEFKPDYVATQLFPIKVPETQKHK